MEFSALLELLSPNLLIKQLLEMLFFLERHAQNTLYSKRIGTIFFAIFQEAILANLSL